MKTISYDEVEARIDALLSGDDAKAAEAIAKLVKFSEEKNGCSLSTAKLFRPFGGHLYAVEVETWTDKGGGWTLEELAKFLGVLAPTESLAPETRSSP